MKYYIYQFFNYCYDLHLLHLLPLISNNIYFYYFMKVIPIMHIILIERINLKKNKTFLI